MCAFNISYVQILFIIFQVSSNHIIMYPSAIIYFIHFNINKLTFIFYIKA